MHFSQSEKTRKFCQPREYRRGRKAGSSSREQPEQEILDVAEEPQSENRRLRLFVLRVTIAVEDQWFTEHGRQIFVASSYCVTLHP